MPHRWVLSMVVLVSSWVAGGCRAAETATPAPPQAVVEDLSKSTAPDELRLDLPGFFPEGIAYDPASRRFFLGSLRQNRIVQVATDGSVSDLVGPCQDGLLGVVGLRVDPVRRELWACSAYDPKGPECGVEADKTGLFKFSLEDGRLLGKWLVKKPDEKYLFNDVVVSQAGDAYATTFAGSEIHKVDASSGEMSLLAKMEGEAWNNGIALSPDERFLLISANEEIYRMDLASREIVEIIPPEGEKLGHADGLYYLEGSLIAVQGFRKDGVPTWRIARSWLTDDYSAVTRIEVLAQDDPAWVVPTTAAVVGQDLYLLATSYLDRIDTPDPEGGRPTHPAQVLVQRLPLSRDRAAEAGRVR